MLLISVASGRQLSKTHLRRVVGEVRLTFEEFYTVITQIEAYLNSRLLVSLHDSAEDITYIGRFTKWHHPSQNICVDLVILCEDLTNHGVP